MLLNLHAGLLWGLLTPELPIRFVDFVFSGLKRRLLTWILAFASPPLALPIAPVGLAACLMALFKLMRGLSLEQKALGHFTSDFGGQHLENSEAFRYIETRYNP